MRVRESEGGNRGITISGFSNSALTAKRVVPYTHTQQMASETGIKINGRMTGQWRTRLMLDVVTAASGFPKRRGECVFGEGVREALRFFVVEGVRSVRARSDRGPPRNKHTDRALPARTRPSPSSTNVFVCIYIYS